MRANASRGVGGHCGGNQGALRCDAHGLGQKRLVPKMHAVEVADGERQVLRTTKRPHQLHGMAF